MFEESSGTALRTWFDRSGLSKIALAKAVTTLAVETGHHQIRPDGSRVRRWLDGERPRDPVPGLLAQVLSCHVGRPLTPEDLGLGRGASDNTRYRGPLEIIDGIQNATRADLTRQPCDKASEADATKVLPALESWAYAPSRQLARSSGAGELGTADVARMAAFTAMFRELENRFGGASMLNTATAHLATAARLLREGTYREHVGRQLHAELADLAGVVGWAAHDAGNYPAAIRYLTLGVQSARESGDRGLTAHLLQCLARIWGHVGDPARASDCLGLALYGARNASPVLRAGLHSLDARFAALMGAEREALRSVHHAREIFADGDDQDVPSYASYLDYAELASTLGEVLLHLVHNTGRLTHAPLAIEFLTEASQGRAEPRIRSRVFDHVGLARVQLAAGELDGACDSAEEALRIGAGLSSARVRRRYTELAGETAGHSDSRLPALRERLLGAA
ncbi:hypothetical protein [Lentzea sp. NPDC059081]|uniref:hypothetical protein n=1 Tax=Lentzea sp. NPDC059081 TaxID=3346719 RepID=UPI003692B67D